jgi:excisionase family DNA binding protein
MPADDRSGPPPVMTAKEVCSYLDISRATLYRLIRTAKIPFFRMGFDYRFNREAIDLWLLADRNNPESMTAERVCAYLRIHRSTLYRMIDDGRIPYSRIGDQYRFSRETIDEWLLVLETQPHPIAKRGPKPGNKRMKSQISSIH